MPVRQLLVMLLQHLPRQLRVRNDDVQRRTEPHRYDWAVGLSPLREAPEPDGLDVVEVADDGPGAWARGEPEAQALVELVEEEEGEN